MPCRFYDTWSPGDDDGDGRESVHLAGCRSASSRIELRHGSASGLQRNLPRKRLVLAFRVGVADDR